MPNGQASSATNSAGRLATSDISRSTRGCCWKCAVIRGSTGDNIALAMTASQPQLTSSQPCHAVAARCEATRGELSIKSAAGARLQAGRQPHAGKATCIAGRLADHGRTTPGTGPEVLDVNVVHLVGDVIEESRHREPTAVGLEPGVQVEDTECPLHRPGILIDQHLRRGAVAVISTEQQLVWNTAQRHALLEAGNGLEFGRVRHGLAVHVLHALHGAIYRHRRASLGRGLNHATRLAPTRS